MASFFSELRIFARTHKVLIILPLLLMALGFGIIVFIFARRSELAPMIYTMLNTGESIGAAST